MLRTIAVAVSLAGTTAYLPATAHAEVNERPPTTATLVAARTEPAVHQLAARFTAELLVAQPQPTKAYAKLFDQAKKEARAGRIGADGQSRLKWVLRTAAADPARYVRPGKTRKVKTDLGPGSCTAWVITPQGHLVTAAHCVEMTKSDLTAQHLTIALLKRIEGETDAFLKAHRELAAPDRGLRQLAAELLQGFHVKTMRVKSAHAAYSLVRLEKGKIRRLPVDLLTDGSPYPGPDVAVLKIRGVRNLPTVPLGRAGDVRVGDPLYVSGFPGNTIGTTLSTNPIDPKSAFKPIFTAGIHNGLITTPKGVPYIHAQAPSYGGNSGGPVFDRHGRVAGLLSAGLRTGSIGGEAEQSSTVLPVGVIRAHLAKAGVRPVTSETTRGYDEALADFFAGRYQAALPKFRKALALYPAHPYARDYIRQITAKRGNDA
ncbi:serine protease [Nonomuraea sp. NPDC050328]|uniref:serine protease n=1 Tax=Nonomuraea sp. NPDC050328 TaxID=3364361 RepID=UPI0037A33888